MDTIKQISIFVENQPGKLAELTRLLADADIDLRTLSLADTRDFGILRVIVNKPDETEQLLKANEVLEVINEANVNVEYMYAFVNRIPGRADTVFRVDDIETTIKALRSKGIEILTPEEAYCG